MSKTLCSSPPYGMVPEASSSTGATVTFPCLFCGEIFEEGRIQCDEFKMRAHTKCAGKE